MKVVFASKIIEVLGKKMANKLHFMADDICVCLQHFSIKSKPLSLSFMFAHLFAGWGWIH
jgi:hypothetical protein